MPIAAGLWLLNPHGAKRKHKKSHRRKRKNPARLQILRNPKGGRTLAKRRRKKSSHRRRKHRKNLTSTLYASNPRKRRRSHRRRKSRARTHRKYYAKRRSNPVRRRRRSHRRRRNPSSIVSRASRTTRSLLSFGTVKNVAAGLAGYAGVNILEPFIPFSPSTAIGVYIKKTIAAVGAYMIGGMVLSSPKQKRYLLYGAALNIGMDIVKQQFPGIASKAKLSGLGYVDVPNTDSLTGNAMPDRVTPYMLNPTIMN